MMRVLRVLLGALVALIVFLALPFLFRDSEVRRLSGPSLSEIRYQEVSFRNGELDLAGMLLRPEGEGPFPGAVFIHGSGTSRRDNKWYLSVADHLVSNGIAVMLPDKRGSEASAGDWRGASFHELAADAQAAFYFLAQEPQIDKNRMGFIGFSQGGWVAPVAASQTSSVAFVVSLSGAGVTTDEQLLFEEINNIAEMGTYRFLARLIAPITSRSIMRGEIWQAIAGFDPLPYWAELRVPVFAALGEGDRMVPVEESVRRFKTLSPEPIVKIYPIGGHGLTDPETGRVQQAFLDDLIEFVENGRIN